MYARRRTTVLGSLLLGMTLLSGCRTDSPADQAKLEEAQKQLEETKKQLEEARKQAAQAADQAQEAKETTPVAGSRAQKAPAPPVAPRPETRGPVASSRVEGPKKAAPAPPAVHTIAAGTPITIRTTNTISTKTATEGSAFEATLAEPLVVDGYVVAPKGARVEGVVAESDPGGRVKGVASMGLTLRSISADGRKLAINTKPVGVEAKKSTKKDALKVGIGSGVGAAIGAIAGGGKGAAIGAGAGAAGGAGVAMATRGDPAVVPAESVLKFTLAESVRVQER